MKYCYLILALVFISCKSFKEVKEENNYTSTTVLDTVEEVSNESTFTRILESVSFKNLPLTDTTKFSNTQEDNFLTKEEVQALQLLELYPNFYSEGYNQRAKPSYKIKFSENFHSLVLSVFKNENELESILINYSLNGNIIDSKVIAYDEMAEGMSMIASKIEQNKLLVNNIFWIDEKEERIEEFKIDSIGKINRGSFHLPYKVLVDSVLHQLGIDETLIFEDFINIQIQPNNPEEAIVVIPTIAVADEENEMFKLDSYIALINPFTGITTHDFYENYESNGWLSHAVALEEIAIDTTNYTIADGKRAFGIQAYYYSRSKPNPYSNRTLSLFVKSENTLKKVLDSYTIEEYWGEWNTICAGEFTDQKTSLAVAKNKTNNYFNIIANTQTTVTITAKDEKGECIEKETTSTQSTTLKFNGEKYVLDTCSFAPLNVFLNLTAVDIKDEPNQSSIYVFDDTSYYMLTIDAFKNGWFRVVGLEKADAGIEVEIPSGSGWVHHSALHVTTRKNLTVLDKPKNGKPIGNIGVEVQVNLKSICANWAEISYQGLTGWIETEFLCGNPLTTCP